MVIRIVASRLCCRSHVLHHRRKLATRRKDRSRRAGPHLALVAVRASQRLAAKTPEDARRRSVVREVSACLVWHSPI